MNYKNPFMLPAKNLDTSALPLSDSTHQIFKDENTNAKIHKHLSDVNDEITDEDIFNIKTVMSSATQVEFEKEARKAGFSPEEISHTY